VTGLLFSAGVVFLSVRLRRRTRDNHVVLQQCAMVRFPNPMLRRSYAHAIAGFEATSTSPAEELPILSRTPQSVHISEYNNNHFLMLATCLISREH